MHLVFFLIKLEWKVGKFWEENEIATEMLLWKLFKILLRFESLDSAMNFNVSRLSECVHTKKNYTKECSDGTLSVNFLCSSRFSSKFTFFTTHFCIDNDFSYVLFPLSLTILEFFFQLTNKESALLNITPYMGFTRSVLSEKGWMTDGYLFRDFYTW